MGMQCLRRKKRVTRWWIDQALGLKVAIIVLWWLWQAFQKLSQAGFFQFSELQRLAIACHMEHMLGRGELKDSPPTRIHTEHSF